MGCLLQRKCVLYGSCGNNFTLYGNILSQLLSPLPTSPPPPAPSVDFYLVSIAGTYSLGKTAFLGGGTENIMCLFVVFLAKLVNISGALFVTP